MAGRRQIRRRRQQEDDEHRQDREEQAVFLGKRNRTFFIRHDIHSHIIQ